MKYGIMAEVYISSDTLNIGAPVGEMDFINAIDPSVFHAQRYCVRVPNKRQTYWLPECDLTDKAKFLSQQADEVIRASLVEYSLEKRDSLTFYEQSAPKSI